MLRGIVIKTYNSYYYVQSAEKVTMCTLRGRFKKQRFSLLVGDEVEYLLDSAGKGVIEEILPRRSLLTRPPVANVDQVVLTFAAASPDINLQLVDRFLVLAEMSRLKTILCINKVDLANTDELTKICNLYQDIGYPVYLLSAKAGNGIIELKKVLYDKITVFAGPSGVGKSTILNALEPGLSLATGELSEKIKRGKHTTRFAQLLAISGGGLLVDTPGFSFTEFNELETTELTYYFSEFVKFSSQCKFNTCLHDKEPQCAVKQAVMNGTINKSRYASYLEILEEITSNRKGFR